MTLRIMVGGLLERIEPVIRGASNKWIPVRSELHELLLSRDLRTRDGLVLVVESPDDVWRAIGRAAAGTVATPIVVVKTAEAPPGAWSQLAESLGAYVLDIAELNAATLDAVVQRAVSERHAISRGDDVVGVVAAKTAHDFGNMLFAIQNNVRAVLEQDLDPETRFRLKSVAEIAEMGSRLSRSLMHLGSAGQLALEGCYVCDVIAETVRVWQAMFPDHIEISIRTPRRPAWVEVDRAQLQQALTNLALNARDAMPQGGRISVTVQQEGKNVHISVADTGPGINRVDAARIFEPFYTTKHMNAGAGLGLSIVHGIITSHGGSLRLVECVAAGAEFRITLPLAKRRKQVRKSTAAVPTAVSVEIDSALLKQLVHEAALRAGCPLVGSREPTPAERRRVVVADRPITEAPPGDVGALIWLGRGAPPPCAFAERVIQPGSPMRVADLSRLLTTDFGTR